jgi:hypothetical protein
MKYHSIGTKLQGGTPVKRVVTLLCLTALCLFMGFSTMAQSDAGALIGTVLDADGKAVVGATVTVTDVNTNLTLPSVKSGDNGRYAVNDLPPGHYRVTISAPNFKSTIENDVEIIQRKTYELPIKLEVGASTVSVEVVAGQQLLETVNTATNATVTGRSITNLPLNSRSSLLLAVLDPGAQTVGGPRNSAYEGLPKGTINITFDGINAQCNLLKSNDGFFSVNDPRIDDVEEFGITTSGNDPSKTGQGAVQVAYTSKRGGNAFHGGVWEYNRNQDFNSNYYFNNAQGLPRQKDQLNDYGYKVGGPIFKDKLFFFTDFDFFEFPQSVTRSRTIYTPLAASGIFNYTPAPGAAAVSGTPNSATPVTCTALAGGLTTASSLCSANLYALAGNNGFPNAPNATVANVLGQVEAAATAPGVTVSSALVSPFQESIGYNASTIGYRKYPDVRLDYNLNKHHSLEFDYHYSHFGGGPDVLNNVDATFPTPFFEASQGNQISNRSLFVLAERWTIGSNKTNEIRFGLQSSPINFGEGVNAGTNGTFFPFAANNLSGGTAIPYVFNPAATAAGTPGNSNFFLPLGDVQGRNTSLGELHETFGWTKGSHQISIGGDATLLDYNDFNEFNATATLGINTNFDPVANIFTSGGAAPGSGNFPGLSSTQQTNAESVYATLVGRVLSYTDTAAFDVANRTYSATANTLNGTNGRIVDKIGQEEFGIYAADSWRVKPNLTFNYGLRWEYQGPPYDKLNQYYLPDNTNDVFGISGPGNLFHPGSTAGNPNVFFQNDAGKSFYNGYHKAFAPSVGLAYQPNWDNRLAHHIFGASGKTVLRAGFSIAYSREGLDSFFGVAEDNPGQTGSQTALSAQANSLANGQFQAGTVSLGQTGGFPFVTQTPGVVSSQFAISPAVGQGVFAFDPNLRPPLVESWNAGVQREITPNLAFEIRYVANHGVGLTDLFNLNEVNIFENGFLNEFNNAENNLAICRANAAACTSAQSSAGVAKPSSSSFGDYGLPGQVALPILTGAFTGSKTGPQTSSLFANSTLINELNVQGAGSFANTIGAGASNFTSFLANLQTAGFPSNFFVVNPQATGGSFVVANAAQSTYNSLVLDLRHRPVHGFQFDVSYVFAKSLTNYQANSAINNASFTTLRNPGYDKAPAPFDVRHNVKGQLVYQLPFGAGHRFSSSHGFVNKAIGGWEVDSVTRFQTGQPILITSGVSGGNTFNNNGPGINLVGLTLGQIQSELGANKTAVPGAVTYVPVNLLSGPGQSATANLSIFQPCNIAGNLCSKPYITSPSFFRADISLVKTTKITERVNFEIRMEALNAFNDADFYYATAPGTAPASISTQSTRFGLIGSTNTNGAYSDINTTQDPGGRIVQLVGRINF